MVRAESRAGDSRRCLLVVRRVPRRRSVRRLGRRQCRSACQSVLQLSWGEKGNKGGGREGREGGGEGGRKGEGGEGEGKGWRGRRKREREGRREEKGKEKGSEGRKGKGKRKGRGEWRKRERKEEKKENVHIKEKRGMEAALWSRAWGQPTLCGVRSTSVHSAPFSAIRFQRRQTLAARSRSRSGSSSRIRSTTNSGSAANSAAAIFGRSHFRRLQGGEELKQLPHPARGHFRFRCGGGVTEVEERRHRNDD